MACDLVFYRQLLIYVDTIREHIESSSIALRSLDDRMISCLKDLTQACRARSAVPVDQVYPKFMELAAIWQGFQDELFLDAFRRGVLDTILRIECLVRVVGLSLSKEAMGQEDHVRLPPLPTDNTTSLGLPPGLELDQLQKDLDAILASATPAVAQSAQNDPVEFLPIADEEIVMSAGQLLSDLLHIRRRAPGNTTYMGQDMEVIHPGNSSKYLHLPVELGGFCPVTLTDPTTQGTVVPGNWNLGLIKYRDKLYAVRTREAAKKFASSPDEYVLPPLGVIFLLVFL
jgi:hypothetical protein